VDFKKKEGQDVIRHLLETSDEKAKIIGVSGETMGKTWGFISSVSDPAVLQGIDVEDAGEEELGLLDEVMSQDTRCRTKYPELEDFEQKLRTKRAERRSQA